jgi:hypothetical protein
MMIKVLVCGGRDYNEKETVFDFLDHINAKYHIICIIHGAARGADTLAGEWATTRNILVEAYPADWNKYGKSAGPIRNRQMLVEGKPDAVIAFPGGKGTENMIRQAIYFGFSECLNLDYCNEPITVLFK